MTTLRFNNSLGRCTELTESYYIHSRVYHRERIQMTTSQRKLMHRAVSKRDRSFFYESEIFTRVPLEFSYCEDYRTSGTLVFRNMGPCVSFVRGNKGNQRGVLSTCRLPPTAPDSISHGSQIQTVCCIKNEALKWKFVNIENLRRNENV